MSKMDPALGFTATHLSYYEPCCSGKARADRLGFAQKCTNACEITIIKGYYKGTVEVTNWIDHFEIGWLPSHASAGACPRSDGNY